MRRSTCCRSSWWPKPPARSGARTISSRWCVVPGRTASWHAPTSTRWGRRAALVHRDEVHGRLLARRSARLTALTSGGAIPDVADYRVLLEPDDLQVGTLNEDFAIE